MFNVLLNLEQGFVPCPQLFPLGTVLSDLCDKVCAYSLANATFYVPAPKPESS